MVMSNRYRTGSSSSFVLDQDEPQSSSENGPDSPLSGDDSRATATTPPLKKSRRSIQKRVVSVPIGDGDGGSRTKGEAYPPSDSWAWRKYGQKPIKGSPYPRGYYRCSSSKGCPARKQVERSRMDPTMLIITYACEHNHPLPTSKHHHHNNHQTTTTTAAATPSATTPPTPSAPTTTTSDDTPADSGEGADDPPSSPLIQINPFGEPPQLEFVGDALVLANLGVEYSWISDVSFNTPSFAGSTCVDAAEVAAFPMKEEDESLFGDLDELPECSTVFRRSHGSSIERCSAAATPLCGSTG